MSNFEHLVRPYQLPDNTPPTILPFGAPTSVTPNVRLEIGRVGSTRTLRGSRSGSQTLYVKKYPIETLANGNTPPVDLSE